MGRTKNKIKILLIAPPAIRIRYNISGVYPLPPLGLAYIASILEKHGFYVRILDMPALRISPEDLPAYLEKEDFKIYGLSCNIFNLKNGIRISRIIKRLNSKAKVMLGGPGTDFSLERIFSYGPDFDVIVKGEGEETMRDLCIRWRNDESIDDVPGIAYRDGARVVTNPDRDYLDLDELPFPARHLLPNQYYRMHPPFDLYPPITLMETSRGCAYHCTFCTLSQLVRERAVTNIIEEAKEAIAAFKVREVHFVDTNFTFNQERTMRLCEALLTEGIEIAWTCKTRVDLVSQELLVMMSKAGCYMISYGAESGSQRILDTLNKEITIADIENAFKLTKKAGIRTLAYIVLGSPGEDDATVKESMNLVKRIRADFVLYGELLPDPGSILENQAIDRKQISNKDLFNYYVFNRRNIFGKRSITNIPKRNMDRWLSEANRSFYLRWSYIMQRLTGLKNSRDLFNLARGAYFLLRDKLKPTSTI